MALMFKKKRLIIITRIFKVSELWWGVGWLIFVGWGLPWALWGGGGDFYLKFYSILHKPCEIIYFQVKRQ